MSTEVKFRRGTTAEHSSFTGAAGEMTVDTDKNSLVVHDGATAGGFPLPAASDIQGETFISEDAGGTADVITLTLSPAITAYAKYQRFIFKAASNNTGSVTLNVNAVGAVAIKKWEDGSLVDLVVDDIIANQIVDVVHDGTQFAYMQSAGGEGGAWEFISSVDFSGAAAAEFTGFDPGAYDAYALVLQNVIPATDVVDLWLRTSTDGGSTYDSGGSHYRWAAVGRKVSATSAVIDDEDDADSEIHLNGHTAVGSAGGEDGVSGIVYIHGPHLAKKTMVTGSIVFIDRSANFILVSIGGIRSSSADVNAVQLRFDSGNLESGTISFYGIKNA